MRLNFASTLGVLIAGALIAGALIVGVLIATSTTGCGKGPGASGPGVNQKRCGENAIADASGQCKPCPAGHAPSGTQCIRGLARVPGEGGRVLVSALGSEWHPDPDGDGIAASRDVCPRFYDPAQNDSDGDGVGDVCDSESPTNDERIALRVEHVTPYGGWFSFASTRSGDPRWRAGVAWSRDRDALTTVQGVADAVKSGAAHTFSVFANRGFEHGPVIVTAMQPGTEYFVASFRRDYQDQVLDVGPIVELTTAPEPKLDLSQPHPRILLTANDIETLRARHKRGDNVWRKVSSRLGELAINAVTPGQRVYKPHSYCSAAALLYLVTQKMKYRDAAAKLLARLLEHIEKTSLAREAYGAEGASLALCMDFLGKEVDTATRARVVTAFLDDDMRNLEATERLEGTSGFAAGTETLLINSLVACGAKDLPSDLREKGCAHLDIAMRRWFGVQLVKARRQRGFYAQSGGYLPEGVDRGQLTAGRWARSFIALANAGVPIAEYRVFLRNLLVAHWLYPLTPSASGYATVGTVTGFAERRRDETEGRAQGWIGEANTAPIEASQAPALALLAGALERSNMLDEAGWARWLIDSLVDRRVGRQRANYTAARLANLLYEHSGIEPRDPRGDLPLGYLDSGFGVLFSRSSWREQASFLMLRAGWTGVDHNQADAGHFQLYRRGRWITHEALGREGVTAAARAHNVLALEGPAREGPRIGQYVAGSGAIVGIIRASARARHTFAVADTTGAYRSHREKSYGYDRVQRSLLWLASDKKGGPDTVVVYDLVDSAEKASDKDGDKAGELAPRLLFHFDAKPALAGRRASITLPGKPKQRAELYAVHPKAASLSALAPEGKPDRYPSAIYTHRVAVDLPVADRQLRALTVLRASDASSNEMPAPRAVVGNDFYGVVTGQDLVLFPATAQDAEAAKSSAAKASVAAPATGSVRVWWSGFAPNARLAISARRQGERIELSAKAGGSVQADDAGLVAVAVGSSGNVSAIYAK